MSGYEQSESIAAIAPALERAIYAIEGAVKNSENPHFRSDYADFRSVRSASWGPLKEAGLILMQWPVGEGGLVVQVTHCESGEWMRSTFFGKPDKSGPQALVSLMTYLRRVSMASILGIPQVDDDGNGASMNDEERRSGASLELKVQIQDALNSTTDAKKLVPMRRRIDQVKGRLIPEDYEQLVALADDLIKTAEEAA